MVKRQYIDESYEYLSGHFGPIGIPNSKKVKQIIGNIYNHAMNTPYEYGIHAVYDITGEYKRGVHSIAKYMNTNDVDTIYAVLDIIFNEEEI